jgi:hypothetical protein
MAGRSRCACGAARQRLGSGRLGCLPVPVTDRRFDFTVWGAGVLGATPHVKKQPGSEAVILLRLSTLFDADDRLCRAAIKLDPYKSVCTVP